MIWAILAILGVPLWLCAFAIVMRVYRNRELSRRPGDVVVRGLGAAPAVATTTSAEGATFDVATRAEHRDALLGPFARNRQPSRP